MFIKGGIGSGNFGHVGRPGRLGGSAGIGATPPDRIAAGIKRYREASGKKEPTSLRQNVLAKKEEKQDKPKPKPKQKEASKPKQDTTPPTPQAVQNAAVVDSLPPAKPAKKKKQKFGEAELEGYAKPTGNDESQAYLNSASKGDAKSVEAVDVYGGSNYVAINGYLRNNDIDFTKIDENVMGDTPSKDRKK